MACYAGLSGFVVTSPSRDHVPKMPKVVDVIQTYVDGRWGIHEYSRHPQWYLEDLTHIACIPRRPSPPEVPDILFQSLDGDSDWEEAPSVAVHGLGLMKDAIRGELVEAATSAIRQTADLTTSGQVRLYAEFLCMLLRQVVDRLNYLPSVATRAVAVAAHIQRLCLQLAGLRTYLEVVVGRINSSEDFSASVLDVVGGFLREGAVTQTWHRVGLPYWVLQPLNSKLSVWRVVKEDALPYDLTAKVCDPPILHHGGAFFGVSNLTGSWVSSMLVSISKHVGGSHLASLDFTSVPDVPRESESSNKRRRIEEKPILSKHLSMREVRAENERSRCWQDPVKSAGSTRNGSAGFIHPSRSFVLSPFVELPQVWSQALRNAGPVPQTPNSALYFFPPPFLLDTVPSIHSLPPGCDYPDRARADAKVDRYLHNLIRIRDFCRARLFDISLESRPLTVRGWRAALWGDYHAQTSRRAGEQTSDGRRAKKRTAERNDMTDLFHKVAHVDSYSPDVVVEFEGIHVDVPTITGNPAIRASLLWESHEVNFRAELLALDSLLVPSDKWMEIHRWEREMVVSGVWGPPSSAASVAAPTDRAARTFCWHSPPDERWQTCCERLRAFAQVLTRWPGCPEVVIQGGKADFNEGTYADVQQRAVAFYVDTFVSRFSRLPIPPIATA